MLIMKIFLKKPGELRLSVRNVRSSLNKACDNSSYNKVNQVDHSPNENVKQS